MTGMIALPKVANARTTIGVITASTTAYSAIVCPSSRVQERMRSFLTEGVIQRKSACFAYGRMPRPGDRIPGTGVRRGWDDCAVAAPPPGPRPVRVPARRRLRGPAAQRDLLLPVVLEHAARRRLRALDAGRPHAPVRPRLAVLSGTRSLLERRPAGAARADARDPLERGGRGRQLLVGTGLARGCAAAVGDPRRA